MIIVLLSILSLIISMDINYVSQHSLIDLKSHFLTSLELYGFRLMKLEILFYNLFKILIIFIYVMKNIKF